MYELSSLLLNQYCMHLFMPRHDSWTAIDISPISASLIMYDRTDENDKDISSYDMKAATKNKAKQIRLNDFGGICTWATRSKVQCFTTEPKGLLPDTVVRDWI